MRVYHLLKSRWALDDLNKGRLKISLVDEMNDPFELLASDLRDPVARELSRVWRESTANLTGAVCFSTSWHDPVIWSHYADRHRGVALGFEIDKQHLAEVTYQTDRLPDMFATYARDHDGASFQERSKLLLTTKYKRWEYESEYRLFAEKKEADDGKYFFDFDPHLKLKSVVLGVRFDGDLEVFKRALRPKYKGAEILTARMAFKSYRIVRQKLKRPWIA